MGCSDRRPNARPATPRDAAPARGRAAQAAWTRHVESRPMNRAIYVLIGASCGCGSVQPNKSPDAPQPTSRTCFEAKRNGADTGKTTLDPDGDGPAAPREVWCEQSRRGGGWALALKVDGTSAMFAGSSGIWSDQT